MHTILVIYENIISMSTVAIQAPSGSFGISFEVSVRFTYSYNLDTEHLVIQMITSMLNFIGNLTVFGIYNT